MGCWQNFDLILTHFPGVNMTFTDGLLLQASSDCDHPGSFSSRLHGLASLVTPTSSSSSVQAWAYMETTGKLLYEMASMCPFLSRTHKFIIQREIQSGINWQISTGLWLTPGGVSIVWFNLSPYPQIHFSLVSEISAVGSPSVRLPRVYAVPLAGVQLPGDRDGIGLLGCCRCWWIYQAQTTFSLWLGITGNWVWAGGWRADLRWQQQWKEGNNPRGAGVYLEVCKVDFVWQSCLDVPLSLIMRIYLTLLHHTCISPLWLGCYS